MAHPQVSEFQWEAWYALKPCPHVDGKEDLARLAFLSGTAIRQSSLWSNQLRICLVSGTLIVSEGQCLPIAVNQAHVANTRQSCLTD